MSRHKTNDTEDTTGVDKRAKEPIDCKWYMRCLNTAAHRGTKQLPCDICRGYTKAECVRANAYVCRHAAWENF